MHQEEFQFQTNDNVVNKRWHDEMDIEIFLLLLLLFVSCSHLLFQSTIDDALTKIFSRKFHKFFFISFLFFMTNDNWKQTNKQNNYIIQKKNESEIEKDSNKINLDQNFPDRHWSNSTKSVYDVMIHLFTCKCPSDPNWEPNFYWIWLWPVLRYIKNEIYFFSQKYFVDRDEKVEKK